MSEKIMSLEDVAMNGYHKLLTVRAVGGWFVDGYILSIIGVVLIYFTQDLHLNNFWQGMIAAAAIIGICIGGIIGGLLTDRYGRKIMFLIAPLLFTIFSALQFFAESGEWLFLCRLLIGIGVGIEYTVGSALLTEFLPKKSRGPCISALVTMWFVGAVCAYIMGNVILATVEYEGWRWVLASSAVLSGLLLLLRLGTQESPRWLMSKQRHQEANLVIQQVYGKTFSTENLGYTPVLRKINLKALILDGYLLRILFVSIFWACCVTPIFAVYSFAPKVLGALNFQGKSSTYSSILITLLFTLGCVIGTLVINKMGRRKMLLHSFLWSLLALLGLGYFADASAFIVLFFFGAYAIFIGGAQILTIVYPNEIFPTEVRAVAVGLCTSISKVGVVLGTWLVPIAVDSIGITNTMYVAALINCIGLMVTYWFAVETSHLKLEDASKI